MRFYINTHELVKKYLDIIEFTTQLCLFLIILMQEFKGVGLSPTHLGPKVHTR